MTIEKIRMRSYFYRRSLAVVLAALLLAGCDGVQSTLAPAGTAAEIIADLFWVMVIAGSIIWVLVVGLSIYATHVRQHAHDPKLARWLIIGGGAIFPSVVLAALLIWSLTLMEPLRSEKGSDLHIAVSGEQWWWRVNYLVEDGPNIELANEIRLPVGKRAKFTLTSPDVIHSFWVPSLGGKVDMIPGRVTTLILEPTETGIFRGACAEYCGASHAFMNFDVVVMKQDEFDQWLKLQAQPADQPELTLAAQGQEAFLANGCGACHTIRGTPAQGDIGPDLTHVASRLRIGAGLLPNTPGAFMRWMDHTQALKPDVKMPSFGMVPQEELTAIAAYLGELE
jgi:cytochrome c oxidase subunit 2